MLKLPDLESVDPCAQWQTSCSVLFGPDAVGQEAGNTLQILLHSAAS